MKNIFAILVLFFFSNVILAQDIKLSEKKLKVKLDSVLKEGNLLYKYEKSAWISSDLALENPKIKDNYGGYLTYEINSTIKTIILKNGADATVVDNDRINRNTFFCACLSYNGF